jgi:hypothetical protein
MLSGVHGSRRSTLICAKRKIIPRSNWFRIRTLNLIADVQDSRQRQDTLRSAPLFDHSPTGEAEVLPKHTTVRR